MNNFDKNWKNAKENIFRLEGREIYCIPGDWESFKKWKEKDLGYKRAKEWQKWIKSLKSAQAKGIAVQRIRVIPKQLPDYIKYEIDSWQEFSVKNGEQIFFLDEDEYQKAVSESGFEAKDFWLFDDERLLIFNYNKNNQFTGDIQIADNGMINRYREMKCKLLKRSTPMDSFIKKL